MTPASPACIRRPLGRAVAAVRALFERDRARHADAMAFRRLQTLLDDTGVSIVVVDAAGVVRYATPSVRQLLGHPPERLIGCMLAELVHPEDVPLEQNQHEQSLAAPGRLLASEVRLRHRDGSWRRLDLRRRNMTGDPSIHGIVLTLRDIVALRAPRGSEMRCRRPVTDVPVGLYRCSTDGRIQHANLAFLTMLGCHDLNAIQGTTVEDLYADPAAWQSLVGRLGRDEAVNDITSALRRRDGTVIRVRTSVRLVHAEDGTPQHLEGAAVDVTDRAQTEEEARRRATRFETLNEIISSAAAASELQALFESTVDCMLKALGGDAGVVWADTTSVLRGMSRETGAALLRARQATHVDPHAPRAVGDWAKHPPAASASLAAAVQQAGFRASIRAPILAESRAIGGISMFSAGPRVWSPGELRLAEAVGKQIGGAVHRLQLSETTRQRTAELEAFYDLSRRLRQARSEQEMYPIIVDHARQLLSADQGALAFASADRETFTVAYTTGIEKEAPGHIFDAQHSRSGRVLRTGITFVTPDFNSEARPCRPDGPPYHFAGPLVIVPVRSEDEVIGTLRMARWKRPDVRPFSDAEARLLQGLAEIAGTAILRARLHGDLERAYLEMVLALARAVDARDSYTSNHSEQIAVRAVRLARALRCANSDVQDIHWAALLHDIGKLGVPDSILRKPGPLDAAEWQIMRQHPIVGSEILRPVGRMRNVALLVRHHQERWDGTGYPDGLRGDDIPLGARILAVVDAYSAIQDDRAYTRGRTTDEALAELRRCAGTQFDPAVVETFCLVAVEHDGEPRPLEVMLRHGGADVPISTTSIERSLSHAQRVGRAVPAMTELAKHLLRPLDLPTVLDEILREIQEVFGYPLCSVSFIDETAQELHVTAQRGFDPAMTALRFAIGKRGIVGWVARHRRAYYAPDVLRDPYYIAASPTTRSNAAFPLIVDDRIFGVLNVESPSVNAFPKESLELLEAFAVLAGLAIQRAQRDDELNRLALTDGLTGLANRRALWEALEREIARARRQESPVSVVMIEVDRFKLCNDVLGHLEGDRILQAIAEALRANTRAMDLVARFGGDEFVLLLPEVRPAAGRHIAERVRAQVEALVLPRPIRVTTSIGLASMPEDGITAEALIDAADRRMYGAKRVGGNCVVAA